MLLVVNAAISAAQPSWLDCHARAPGGVFMPNRQTDMEDTVALRVPKAELPTGLSESMIKQFGAGPSFLAEHSFL